MAVKGIVDPHIEEADVHAFRALSLGQASPEQQQRAMDWLGVEACRLLQDPHSEVKLAGGDRDDVIFALGRRYVGILIREMHLPSVLEQARKVTASRRPPEKPKNPTLAERRAAKRQK